MKWLVFFSVFLVSTTAAMKDMCPPGALIRPCVCVRNRYPATVLCVGFTSASDLEDAMGPTYDYPVRGIQLSDAALLYVTSSVLVSKQTERISLTSSVLDSLFDRPPDLENVLTHVRLSDVRLLRGVQWTLFRTMKDLRDVSLASVEVRKIGRTFRKNVNRELRSLALVDTKTVRVEDDAFSDLSQLEVIQVKETRISQIERSMFANPSRIVLFDFSDNWIKNLPPDMFESMPRLQEVILEGNKIILLQRDAFIKLFNYNVFQINMSNNPLACICQIEWLLTTTKRLLIYGHCAVPSTLKGKAIMNLSEQDFDYCHWNDASRMMMLWNLTDFS